MNNNARVAVSLQVRMGSSRLPGKATTKINGRPVIEWIVRRLRKCNTVSSIVIATSTLPSNDILEKVSERLGIPCFRGSETDLIGRHLGCAKSANADAIVRITADCPFVDYSLVDKMVSEFIRADSGVDVVTNVFPPTFPDGLDVEVISTKTLERMDREVVDSVHREWLTMYIYNNPDKFRIVNVKNDIDTSYLRWTLDYPEDLELMRVIYAAFAGNEDRFTYSEVMEFILQNPETARINSTHVDKPVEGIRSQAYRDLHKKGGKNE